MASKGTGKYGIFFEGSELTEAKLVSLSVDELELVYNKMKELKTNYLFPEVGKLLELKKSALEAEKAETKLKDVKSQIAKTNSEISSINEQIKNAENINNILKQQSEE